MLFLIHWPRWQPYSSITSTPAPSLRSSPNNYLNTPASSVTPSPPSTSCLNPVQTCHTDRSRKLLPNSSQSVQIREALKNRYVTRLVDQAVNSLCDIWHPDDIPIVFRTSSRTAFSASLPCDTAALQRDAPPNVVLQYSHHRNTQLPSPISPSTQPSPYSPPPIPSTSSVIAIDETSSSESPRGSQHLPIKGFVHEVLRRSRTSTGVLQTALCYLEAIRGKVPEILRKEKSKADSTEPTPEEEAESRIIIGEVEEELRSLTDACDSNTIMAAKCDIVDTIRIDENDPAPLTAPPTLVLPSMSPSSMPTITVNSKTPSMPLPPMPPLPSPLLCPRRTFLACLILASKFMQDRSYSNRAWAKLAGLPPREIGRCERALGEALQWRLWVGKSPANAASSASGLRPVTRCRSENDLSFSVSDSATMSVSPPSASNISKVSGLRRHATVPTLGSNSAPVQDRFVQHSMFLNSRPVEEPENILSDTCQAESPAAMFVSPPTMFVTPPPASSPGSYIPAPLHHPQSFASISHFFTVTDDSSPSLSTPGLSYSPMSTASTSSSEDGERTIQMSSCFMDLPTPLPVSSMAKFDLATNAMNTKSTMETSWSGMEVQGQGYPYALNAPDHTATTTMPMGMKMDFGASGLLSQHSNHLQVPVSVPMVVDPPSSYNLDFAHPVSVGMFPTANYWTLGPGPSPP
ncbi:unnamed protein product [Somion occarium]|uniref:G1/S-specific cyclin pas1 n=1 Tax=Somion occarium TaxID=3059160 RepID=A0ABP1DKX9_9APHY